MMPGKPIPVALTFIGYPASRRRNDPDLSAVLRETAQPGARQTRPQSEGSRLRGSQYDTRGQDSRATFAEDGLIRNASFRPKLFRVLLGGCGPAVRSGDVLHRPGIHPRKLVYSLKDSG